MANDAMRAFATNVNRLMAHRKMTQSDLASRANVGQTTISSALRYPETEKIATLDTVQAIAKALGVAPWLLQVPDVPIELLLSNDISKLVEAYADVGSEGRTNILRVAENEARYEIVRQEKAG